MISLKVSLSQCYWNMTPEKDIWSWIYAHPSHRREGAEAGEVWPQGPHLLAHGVRQPRHYPRLHPWVWGCNLEVARLKPSLVVFLIRCTGRPDPNFFASLLHRTHPDLTHEDFRSGLDIWFMVKGNLNPIQTHPDPFARSRFRFPYGFFIQLGCMCSSADFLFGKNWSCRN